MVGVMRYEVAGFDTPLLRDIVVDVVLVPPQKFSKILEWDAELRNQLLYSNYINACHKLFLLLISINEQHVTNVLSNYCRPETI